MFIYLLYFINFYPFIFYLLRLYKLYEYYSFTKKVYNIVFNFYNRIFISKKNSKEIDEIYEFVLESEPHKSIIKDDTNYIKYNEKNKIIKDNYIK